LYTGYRNCKIVLIKAYSITSYDETNAKHLETFHNFGIVKLKKKKRFYVTPLIKCLFEDMSNVFEAQEGFKFLIVETNFKIYAYTDSPLEKAVLEFLFEIEYIFPGLIIAHITRKSLRNVLKRGVCATKVPDTNLGSQLSQHACKS
jgi:transcription initiation factor TFIIH subunit 4